MVVHGRGSARNGETVIALLQNSHATVKKLYREKDGWVRLQPANAALEPIYVHENDLTIQGVVVGVIRRY